MDKRLKMGYISFFTFMIVLSAALIFKPKIPIQTILAALALVIMIMGRAKLQDLLAGIILHPLMAMASGFLIAGAMGLAGGFDVLMLLLNKLASLSVGGGSVVNLSGQGFPVLGYIGVAIILVNVPTIMPMPCGRIIAAALIPGVFRYGLALSDLTGNIVVLPVLLSAFIVNAAASCGPSPLGGIGGIGEGNLGVEIGLSTKPQSAGILIATGTTALVISFVVGPTLVTTLQGLI